MGRVGGRKQAISLTLDDKVCTFFKGKNRSKEINRILTAYLRHQLGETRSDIGFTEEVPISSMVAQAMNAINRTSGHGEAIWSMLNTIRVLLITGVGGE